MQPESYFRPTTAARCRSVRGLLDQTWTLFLKRSKMRWQCSRAIRRSWGSPLGRLPSSYVHDVLETPTYRIILVEKGPDLGQETGCERLERTRQRPKPGQDPWGLDISPMVKVTTPTKVFASSWIGLLQYARRSTGII